MDCEYLKVEFYAGRGIFDAWRGVLDGMVLGVGIFYGVVVVHGVDTLISMVGKQWYSFEIL